MSCIGAPVVTNNLEAGWNATQMPLSKLAREVEEQKEETALPDGHTPAVASAAMSGQYSTLAPHQAAAPLSPLAEEDPLLEQAATLERGSQSPTLLPGGGSNRLDGEFAARGKGLGRLLKAARQEVLDEGIEDDEDDDEDDEDEAPPADASEADINPMLIRCQPLRLHGA